jgi:hypothetical protein
VTTTVLVDGTTTAGRTGARGRVTRATCLRTAGGGDAMADGLPPALASGGRWLP